MKKIPFYSNTADDTHCVQAVFKMVLKYFKPERDFSWDELDELSKKQPGKGTWWFPMLANFKDLGIETVYIEAFDYQRYFLEGSSYLKSFYGKDTAQWFSQKSNIESVKPLIPSFLISANLIKRPPTMNDLVSLVNDDWLVGVEINTKILLGEPGFNGHMVLVYEQDDNDFIVHDPGLPPRPQRGISKDGFAKSWMYAGADKAALIAFRNQVK